MGLKDRYNKAVASGNTGQIIRNPNKPLIAPDLANFNQLNFASSSLDLTNPLPLGGPINLPYTSQIGSEVKTFTTTQPYLPQNGKTYIDSLQDQALIARASDPFK